MKAIQKMDRKKWAILGVSLVALMVFLFLLVQHNQRNIIPVPPKHVIEYGYLQNDVGLQDVEYKDPIAFGKFKEVVANKRYLLAIDDAGTLSLIDSSSRAVTPVTPASHAYQLKVVGDNDFGYLQLIDGKQFITFLDPETGKTSRMETSANVISWDTEGTDIAYHLYETTTLGFAKYDNNLGWSGVQEMDAGIATMTQLFTKNGKNYAWVVTTTGKNVIYSMDTHEDVTTNFPNIATLEKENGVLAAIVGNYWIVTSKTQGTAETGKSSTQVWDSEGHLITDLDSLGYEIRGDVVEGNNKLYFPVTYTNGTTPDGLLIMHEADHHFDFQEDMKAFIYR